MIYNKIGFTDGQNKYSIKDQSDNVLHADTKIVYTGSGGTPLSSTNMNKIEQGIIDTINSMGRVFSNNSWKDTVFTSCGLNSNGELTLDNAIDSYSMGIVSLQAQNFIYGSNGYGERFDAIATATMDYIDSIYFYIGKSGSPPTTYCIFSIFNETTGTYIYPRTNIYNSLTMNAYNMLAVGVAVTRGHILQFRFDTGGYGDASNYYMIHYNTGNTLNGYAISTTNTWGTVTSVTSSDLSIQVNYRTFKTISGTAVKTISPTKAEQWISAKFTPTTPVNTTVVCDILNSSNGVLISNVTSLQDISSINSSTYPIIKIRWTLTRDVVATTTPKASEPSATWLGEAQLKLKMQIFTSSSTFVAPFTGSYKVTVVGGGGGGATGGYSRNGYGGGGGMAVGITQLTAGTSYAVVVGNGGSGATTQGSYGATGGTSSFNGISATGGTGGYAQNTNGDGYGGSGGNGSGGTINLTGQPGVTNYYNYNSSSYGTLGASPLGLSYGQGGTSGAGQAGCVIIEWIE